MKLCWSMSALAILASVISLMTAGCASQPCRRQPNFGCGTPEAGAQKVKASPLQLVVSLTDGTRVVGETTLTSLSFRSAALGRVGIPLEKIRAVKFSADHESASIALQNGDKVQGSLDAVSLTLRTLFGRVTVPLETTVEIEIRKGGLHLVEWIALPFHKDSDWPATRGEPAIIQDNDILIQGRPVRSQQTFTESLTMECDVQLEKRFANDGSLDLFLIPPNLPCDRYPKPMVNLRLIYSNTGDYGSVDRIDMNKTDERGGNSTWSDRAFQLAAGKVYHLQLEVTNAGQIRLHIDGKEIKIPDTFKLSDHEFQVQISGWQPTNRWHVRNFIVR